MNFGLTGPCLTEQAEQRNATQSKWRVPMISLTSFDLTWQTSCKRFSVLWPELTRTRNWYNADCKVKFFGERLRDTRVVQLPSSTCVFLFWNPVFERKLKNQNFIEFSDGNFCRDLCSYLKQWLWFKSFKWLLECCGFCLVDCQKHERHAGADGEPKVPSLRSGLK